MTDTTSKPKLELEQTPGACVLSCGPVRLAFRFTSDRWEHQLGISLSPGDSVRLDSVEGSEPGETPASPVFQELHVQPLDDWRQELQLLGQSGKCLYSGAIRFDAELGQIDFDLAVRQQHADASGAPRSTYVATGVPAGFQILSKNVATLNCAVGTPVRIETAPATDPLVEVSLRFPSGGQDPAQSRLELGCFDLSKVRYIRSMATIRWRYQFLFAK